MDENGKPILDANGKPEKETIILNRPYCISAIVFNAELIDGMPPYVRPPLTWQPVERAERILTAQHAPIKNDAIQAYYLPSEDEIHLPPRETFPDAERYYGYALHEAAHSAGHQSRLNRPNCNTFGSDAYAREELRAEIGSMLLSAEIGLSRRGHNNEAYVANWCHALKDYPTEILKATADAEKIRQFMLDRERKLTQPTEQTATQTQTQAVPEQTPPQGQTANRQEMNTPKKEQPIQPVKTMSRDYIYVPYPEKSEAKALGAKRDMQAKSWFVPEAVTLPNSPNGRSPTNRPLRLPHATNSPKR